MFGKKLREAQKTIDSQRDMLSQQEDRLRKTQVRNNELTEAISKSNKEITEFKTKVREQTEADLLLVSMKIIEEIKKGTPKKDPGLVSLHQEQARLRALGAQMGSIGSYGDPGWGLQAMGIR